MDCKLYVYNTDKNTPPTKIKLKLYKFIKTCAQHKGSALTGTLGKWGQGRGRGEGGPGPPSREGDKQSTPNKEGGNMEQEEERVRRDEEESACTE
jgi:hypothetical protein